MQYVNDDMDEMFRRAAENYPLDTSSADWNKVLAALQGKDETKGNSEKNNNKKGRFLWLLLLLPLGLVCNQLYTPGILKDKGIAASNEAKRNSAPGSASDSRNDPNRKGGAVPAATNGSSTLTSNVVEQPEGTPRENFGLPTISRPVNTSAAQKARFKRTPGNYPGAEPLFSTSHLGEGTGGSDPVTGQTSGGRSYVTGIYARKLSHGSPQVIANRRLHPLFDLSSEPTARSLPAGKRKKFYAGITGGLDATTIKFQKIENAGFSYGLLLGYQFNRRWSIETGAYLEKKYYYSDAKYFNTSKIYIPPNSWIDDVSGNCKMIEVPLAARYNFGFRKQSNWFSTLGISSYFMMKENYTYNYYYGTTGPVPHTKQYKNSSTDLFSNISVSAGYAHKLGNFADLRIEPYLKLPVSGTGIGSLPLFSMGLQVGVSRKF